MPALPGDIAAGMRASVTATWSDPAIKTRYSSARDDSEKPAEGWFDAIADAQTIANARGVVFGVDRHRYAVTISGPLWLDPSLGLPQIRLIDPELVSDVNCLAPKYLVDLDTETTSMELIG